MVNLASSHLLQLTRDLPHDAVADESTLDDFRAVLAELLKRGLSQVDCLNALAANRTPYELRCAAYASETLQGEDEVAVDDNALTSPGEDGCWVQGWFLISPSEVSA
ncbi:MAG TPA: hypothetical protein VFF76_00350 [Holophagaceae bacterium]|jgi:hypothetical protein|nr:hypothetical protein [Holophagaceae bacterium]